VSLKAETWVELRRRIRGAVRGRVPPSDVDDVVQEALLRVHRGLPSLRNASALAGWVTSVIHGTVVDFHRRQPTIAAAGEERGHDEASVLAHLEPFVIPFLELVREPYRSALVLTDVEGLGQAEAARRLGLAPSTVKSRVQRGRKLLRQTIEECCAVDIDSRGQVVDLAPTSMRARSRRR
jgi:RNA polymerase sigma-70 factor (ECF subfamily)